MCVLGVEGSEKKCGPPPLRIISGTALMRRQCRVYSVLSYNQQSSLSSAAVELAWNYRLLMYAVSPLGSILNGFDKICFVQIVVCV